MIKDSGPELKCEQLIEALTKTRGFILAAKKYLSITYRIEIGCETIKKRIALWGMQDWLDELRKSLVEDCLQKTFSKGIAEGDNHCLMWVLDKFGHHTDFLDGKDTETQAKKGWKELLDYVKADIKSDTEAKSSGEHSET
jgi:hypothetical protein